MSKKTTTPEEIGGGKKQPGKEDIQNTIRPHVPSLIAKAIKIANNSKNDSNSLGAIKMLLAKVVPDLKASEVDATVKLIGPIIYKPSTFNENMEAIPKTGDSA